MNDVRFLRTVALISAGKLSHITYRWKGGTSFSLEQIASTLYRIERSRAKAAARIAGGFSTAVSTPLVAASLYFGWHYARPNGVAWAFLAAFWILVIGISVARVCAQRVRRFTYRHFMKQDVPAKYATELKKFSGALQNALNQLDMHWRSAIIIHRDEMAAQAVALLDSKAEEIVQLERALDGNGVNDEILDRLEAEVSERREEFKLAYAELAEMNLVGGGYTNFFRRAKKVSQEAVAA